MRERVYCPVHQKEVVVYHDINPETGRSLGVQRCSHFSPDHMVDCNEECVKHLNAAREQAEGGDLRERKLEY